MHNFTDHQAERFREELRQKNRMIEVYKLMLATRDSQIEAQKREIHDLRVKILSGEAWKANTEAIPPENETVTSKKGRLSKTELVLIFALLIWVILALGARVMR